MDTNIESKELSEKMQKSEESRGSKESKMKKGKSMSVKTAVTVAVVIVFLALAFYCKGWFIAATVNGSPVSRFAVISDLEKADGKKTLDAIITKKLLNDEAKKKGIVVTNDEMNAEIKKIEDQIKSQGGTLDQVLSSQGLTRQTMEEQIMLQKKLEKLLADKIMVTDEEAMKLLVTSKVTVPKGEEEKYKEQAISQIRGQKLNDAVGAFIETLRAQSSIKYFVNY